jgi:hypothetical protein
MLADRAQVAQDAARLADAERAGDDPGVRRDSDEAGLRNGARRPRSLALIEPCGDRLVMDMRVPRERDERVDVEQRDAAQSSSSARRIISGVIGAAPAGERMTGRPC